MFSFALLVLLGISTCNANPRTYGACPKIQAEDNVVFDQGPCLRYNITQDRGNPGHYGITETHSSSGFVDAIGFHYETDRSVDITIPDPSQQGVLDIKMPFGLGNYKVTIFLTDYDNYLAMFSCRNLPFTKTVAHTWSAQIFSREKVLRVEYLEKARSRLSVYNLNPFLLDNTDQNNCAEAGSQGVFLKAAVGGLDILKDTVGQVSDNVLTKVKDVIPYIN